MDPVREFVRAAILVVIAKNPPFILSYPAELVVVVLEFEVCQFKFVYNFFANLSVERNILKAGFTGDFVVLAVLPSTESHLILVDDDEFAPHPCCDLFIRLADSPSICAIVTLLELD